MTIRARGELVSPTDQVNLTATFYDVYGNPANTDQFPTIAIIQPSGLVGLPPTTAGVQQLDVGKYLFQYTVGINPAYGVWQDLWQGTVAGQTTIQTLSFVVSDQDLPQLVNSDGYQSLGDLSRLDYSQLAIHNINLLMRTLRARLNSSGKAKTTDGYGNTIYVNCDIFSTDMLVSFIADALTKFNEVPYFTWFNFEDTAIIGMFHNVIVEGATLMALASQALIEKGREYTITDNGVSFTPPSISELLSTQWSTLLTAHTEKLKYIKNSMRPKPIGLGTFSMTGSMSPVVKNLRLLRARQIF